MSKLQELRKEKRLSQSALAEKVNVSAQKIRAFEQGWRNINNTDLFTLLKLCNVLDCKLENILDDEKTLTELQMYRNRISN